VSDTSEQQDAIRREQRLRNAAYLRTHEIICGERVKNLTPYLMAVLSAIESPFLCGGGISHAHCSQFIWAIHESYLTPGWHANWRKSNICKRLASYSLPNKVEAIQAFLDITFLDGEKRIGKQERQIVSDCGWLVYRFHESPWNYSEETTLHTPIRILYQELRAWTRFHTDIHVANQSDIKISDWMDKVNKQRELWHTSGGREGISPERWEAYQRKYFGEPNDRN
jgi:hypothetical protein